MHKPVRVLVGSLAAGVLPAAEVGPPDGTVLLDLGRGHPSNAGLLELKLWTEDGLVTSARIVVGAMHRGAEKLFEVRDYRQILMLADRHDWQAPFFGELAVALACEQMLGLTVPARAVWLRTLLAEHTRILSHLGFLSYLEHRSGVDVGLEPVREQLRSQTARLTGNRIHPMANRVGGLAVDAEPGWLAGEREVVDGTRAVAPRLFDLLNSEPVAALTRGTALLDRAVVEQYGVSGPAARAAGVDLDLRRQQPGLAYPELLVRASTRTEGDAYARLAGFIDEVASSADLVAACIDRLADQPGPVAVKLGKIVRLPEGEAYVAVEAPLGIAGVFVVSRGEKTPWRMKLRTPSFSNVSALESVLVGVRTDQIEATLASIGYVVGDIDR